MSDGLAIKALPDILPGRAPHAVDCGRGVQIGSGTVIPEVHFTLPPLDINETTWLDIRNQYEEMIASVCARALERDVPGLLVEFETLPPMIVHPAWGAEISQTLAETLDAFHAQHGLKSALRLTPNDTRDHERPPCMRSGPYWDELVDAPWLPEEDGITR